MSAGAAAAAPAGLDRQSRRVLRYVCLLLLAIYLLTMAGRVISGDGEAMYQTTRALLTRGQLSIDARPETAPGRDGRHYSKYGLGQSLVQAPFFAAGHIAGRLWGASDDRAARFAVGMTNSFVTVALAAVFWLTLRALGTGRGGAVAGTLLLALATPLWPYARADFAEPLQALSLLLAFYALIRFRGASGRASASWAALAGLCAGLAVLTKAASVILLPPLTLYLAWTLWGQPLRRSSILPAVVAAVPFAALVAVQLALNLYRFGSPTEFGYGDEPATGFTTPVMEGIGYLLISSGKGLLPFAPPVAIGLAGLAWLARRRPAEAAAAAGVFLFELLYYARWWAWHGDWCWGPRYMVVTIPFAMLGWAPLLSGWHRASVVVRGLAALSAAAGFFVSLLGVAIDYGAYFSVATAQIGRSVDARHVRLVPEFSPILGHAWLAQASLYDALARGPRDPSTGTVAHNPYRNAYPWARAFPDLVPEAPERAYGFDFWFAALKGRSPLLVYWSNLVATWLALSLLPLSAQLWRDLQPGGTARTEHASRLTGQATELERA